MRIYIYTSVFVLHVCRGHARLPFSAMCLGWEASKYVILIYMLGGSLPIHVHVAATCSLPCYLSRIQMDWAATHPGPKGFQGIPVVSGAAATTQTQPTLPAPQTHRTCPTSPSCQFPC